MAKEQWLPSDRVELIVGNDQEVRASIQMHPAHIEIMAALANLAEDDPRSIIGSRTVNRLSQEPMMLIHNRARFGLETLVSRYEAHQERGLIGLHIQSYMILFALFKDVANRFDSPSEPDMRLENHGSTCLQEWGNHKQVMLTDPRETKMVMGFGSQSEITLSHLDKIILLQLLRSSTYVRVGGQLKQGQLTPSIMAVHDRLQAEWAGEGDFVEISRDDDRLFGPMFERYATERFRRTGLDREARDLHKRLKEWRLDNPVTGPAQPVVSRPVIIQPDRVVLIGNPDSRRLLVPIRLARAISPYHPKLSDAISKGASEVRVEQTNTDTQRQQRSQLLEAMAAAGLDQYLPLAAIYEHLFRSGPEPDLSAWQPENVRLIDIGDRLIDFDPRQQWLLLRHLDANGFTQIATQVRQAWGSGATCTIEMSEASAVVAGPRQPIAPELRLGKHSKGTVNRLRSADAGTPKGGQA